MIIRIGLKIGIQSTMKSFSMSFPGLYIHFRFWDIKYYHKSYCGNTVTHFIFLKMRSFIYLFFLMSQAKGKFHWNAHICFWWQKMLTKNFDGTGHKTLKNVTKESHKNEIFSINKIIRERIARRLFWCVHHMYKKTFSRVHRYVLKNVRKQLTVPKNILSTWKILAWIPLTASRVFGKIRSNADMHIENYL